jgi:hypothetical protein
MRNPSTIAETGFRASRDAEMLGYARISRPILLDLQGPR